MAALPSIMAWCTTSTRDERSSPSTGRSTRRATGHGAASYEHSIRRGMGVDSPWPGVSTVRGMAPGTSTNVGSEPTTSIRARRSGWRRWSAPRARTTAPGSTRRDSSTTRTALTLVK